MAKRTAESDDSPYRKRLKTNKDSTPAPEKYEIRSSRDLQLLLAFDQDVGPGIRHSKNHREYSCRKKGKKKEEERI